MSVLPRPRREPQAVVAIDNELCAVGCGERSQALEVARRERDTAHIAGHRYQDHSGHVIGLGVHEPPPGIEGRVRVSAATAAGTPR